MRFLFVLAIVATSLVTPICFAQDISISKIGVEDCGGTGGDGPESTPCGSGLIIYNVTVTNNGPLAATNVTIEDALPGSVLFGSVISQFQWSCTAPPHRGTGTVTCNRATLLPGESRLIAYTVLLPLGYPQHVPLVNTATVSATTPDPNPANNSSTSTLAVHLLAHTPTLSEAAILALALALGVGGYLVLQRR